MKNARCADGINCAEEDAEGTEIIIKMGSAEIITVQPTNAFLNMPGPNWARYMKK